MNEENTRIELAKVALAGLLTQEFVHVDAIAATDLTYSEAIALRAANLADAVYNEMKQRALARAESYID